MVAPWAVDGRLVVMEETKKRGNANVWIWERSESP